MVHFVVTVRSVVVEDGLDSVVTVTSEPPALDRSFAA